MKRFLLFAGDDYYATGGWGDFRGDFEFVMDTQTWLKSEERQYPDGRSEDRFDWWHVVDTTTGKVVASKEGGYCGQVKVSK